MTQLRISNIRTYLKDILCDTMCSIASSVLIGLLGVVAET
jgi:hypothetical protein